MLGFSPLASAPLADDAGEFVLTGQQASGVVGSVTVVINVAVDADGVAAAGAAGSVTVSVGSGNLASVTGVAGTMPAPLVANVIGTSTVGLTGVGSTATVGEVTQRTSQVLPIVAPAAMSGLVNGPTVSGTAVVTLDGIAAITGEPRVLVWGKILPDEDEIWTEITI